jgi:predicted TIM-barrel fold metal-dependent hydrolase
LAVDELKRAFDAGLVGLYLHPGRQGFHLTEAVVDPLIEVCGERGKPVYSHTGTPDEVLDGAFWTNPRRLLAGRR